MKQIFVLDGAMGTMLQAAGLMPGEHPEVFAMEHPEKVADVHRAYQASGSQIVYANTFGANAFKLKGTGLDVQTAVSFAVKTAKEATSSHALVALDVGPIGELLKPLGTLSFSQAYDAYAQVVKAGTKAGADLIIIETFTDLQDARAALLAAKEHSSLPVWVTMSFETDGRTFTGTSVESMALTLTGLGADAIGVNCSLGPTEILPILERMSEWTNLPLILKPNAGLPDPATGEYGLSPKDFGLALKRFSHLPILAIGGCCGTSPEYIASAVSHLKEAGIEPFSFDETISLHLRLKEKQKPTQNGICSSTQALSYNTIHPVGERINPTGKKLFAKALKEHDMAKVCNLALEQTAAGAHVLDVNVGVPGEDEESLMIEVLESLLEVVDVPLMIDSTNPKVIEAALRIYPGKAIVNSVDANDHKLSKTLPIVKKYGAAIVGLTMDAGGLPQNSKERIAHAKHILEAVIAHDIPREDLIIDCLTLTVSAQQEQAMETLRALSYVHDHLHLHATLGVSNISFGLPQRMHLTQSFLTLAMYCGLDFPIINPSLPEVMNAITSFRVLSGEDLHAKDYIKVFQEIDHQKTTPQKKDQQNRTIEDAIYRGLKDETRALANMHLTTMQPLELVNQKLIPALDRVGEDYEKGILFLPQLISSANAATEAFNLIKEQMKQSGAAQTFSGKILVATVQGDIHDIGKNIVKIVLENYGYEMIDLGIDVSPTLIVEEVKRQNIRLVGLSALMTTTLPSMKKTIQMLKDENLDVTIMVGGAVLTNSYAKEIGADYYAKDARACVEIARKVFG